MKTNSNKIIMIILIVLVVIMSIFITFILYISNENENKQSNEKTYEITTALNDKFLIWEKLVTKFPDYAYDVEIFDNSGNENKSILKLHHVEIDYDEKEIKFLFSNDNIKAYMYSNYIIYKEQSDDSFKSLWIANVITLDPDKYEYLVPVIIEITHKSWEYAHVVSEFLVKSNVPEAISTIKRYANGEFTAEEVENNRYSGFSAKEMQEYYEKLLSEYNIEN